MFLAVHARRERIQLLLAIAGVALLAGIAVALS
jgi:hypothetical protein